MAHPRKSMSEMRLVDTLTDRLRSSITSFGEKDKDDNFNKPDFRELDLGSPVSPLQARTITATSSSSSSSGSVSGRNGTGLGIRKSESSHSGELSGSVESSSTSGRGFKQGHNRSYSSGSQSLPLIYSGGSTANSPPVNVLPAGNICPSGKILKAGITKQASKPEILGSGAGHYGHGSIMRGGAATASKLSNSKIDSDGGLNSPKSSSRGGGGGLMVGGSIRRGGMPNNNDPEELKSKGNEYYKKGHFADACCLYDKAIAISPGNAAYHCNRAAALMGLRRLSEAVKECEEAIKLDPGYVRAHYRLGSLLLRWKRMGALGQLKCCPPVTSGHSLESSLGQVESARSHLCIPGHKADPDELQKLQLVEKHLSRCTDFRRVGDWRNTLNEADAVIAAGADSCPQLFACRAEALLKLHQVEDADSCLSSIPKFQPHEIPKLASKFFGILSDAYLLFVRAQVDLSLGRFENAVGVIEKAGQVDPRSAEVSVLQSNVRLVCRARARGNDLFKSERFTEACSAYGEGLRLDPSNSVLYCNRAACWFKLGLWERSLDDCNKALSFQPNYTKALLRRAASNSKLERWAEAVRDYEILRSQLPDDSEVAESLFHAQVALKKSRGEEVSNMKFGGEVELISSIEQFKAAIASPGASVVHFLASTNSQCKQISPVLDMLCAKYPMINFLKVNIEDSPAIANAENVRFVPTIKIYRRGSRVKEMISPSPDVLESSVRHYSY